MVAFHADSLVIVFGNPMQMDIQSLGHGFKKSHKLTVVIDNYNQKKTNFNNIPSMNARANSAALTWDIAIEHKNYIMSHMPFKIHVAPVGLVILPGLQMSKLIIAKGVNNGHECTSCLLANFVLCAWMHAAHALTHRRMSFLMSGHKNRNRNTTRVLLIPRWPPTPLAW